MVLRNEKTKEFSFSSQNGVKKWILGGILFLSIFQIGLSQIESEILFQISRQGNKFDKVKSNYDVISSLSSGMLYHIELGFFLSNRFNLSIGIGYTSQKSKLKFIFLKTPALLKSTYWSIPFVTEYTYFIKDKTALFCGIGIQRKQVIEESANFKLRNRPLPSFLNDINYHTLLRSGIRYSNRDVFLKIAAQIDLPVFKNESGNIVLLGLNIAFGFKYR